MSSLRASLFLSLEQWNQTRHQLIMVEAHILMIIGATGWHPVFSYIRIPKHNPNGSLCPSGLEFCSGALNGGHQQTLLSTEPRPATRRHQRQW